MNFPVARAATLLLLLVLDTPLVHAHKTDAWKPNEENASWRAECSACHMAFPPSMLGAGDWRRLMTQLDQHFGIDASLDQPVHDEISLYLERNGADRPTEFSAQELPRITTTERFLSKHQGAIRLWRRGRVDRLSNCLACHPTQR